MARPECREDVLNCRNASSLLSSSTPWTPTSTPNVTVPPPPQHFHVDNSLLAGLVVLAATSLVVGLGAGFGLLLRDYMSRRRKKASPTRGSVLLHSYVVAGILHTLVYTPVLLTALVRNNASESINMWTGNVGWLVWACTWAVQVVDGILITYERYMAVKSPISGQLSFRLSVLLTGISWVCGGVIGVLLAGGFPHSVLQLTCAPESHDHHRDENDFLLAIVVVVVPGGITAYGIIVSLWTMMASTVRKQGKVSVTSGGAKKKGVGECGRPRCPCHGEVELVTISRTSGAFCPTCASSGWWVDNAQPQDKLQLTVPLFAGAQASAAKPHSKVSKRKNESEAAKGIPSSPSSALAGSSLEEEDTFTLGGVYIGSLESHVRTHQALCSGMNVRSQGCQTGELEASPPVIEWRFQMSTEDLPRLVPTLEHVGTQCSASSPGSEPMKLSRSHSQRSTREVLQVSGEVCVRDARTRLAGRTRMEAGRSVPAVLLVLVQMVLWLPMSLAAVTLFFSEAEADWAWRVMMVVFGVNNLSPAFGPAVYLVVGR